MFFERICYEVGSATAEIFLFTFVGPSGYTAYKCLSKVANLHKIDSDDVDVLSNNLFECLPFIE